jgi:hypothetical protein
MLSSAERDTQTFEPLASGKPICEPIITLVASRLPTFYGLPLAKYAAFA